MLWLSGPPPNFNVKSGGGILTSLATPTWNFIPAVTGGRRRGADLTHITPSSFTHTHTHTHTQVTFDPKLFPQLAAKIFKRRRNEGGTLLPPPPPRFNLYGWLGRRRRRHRGGRGIVGVHWWGGVYKMFKRRLIQISACSVLVKLKQFIFPLLTTPPSPLYPARPHHPHHPSHTL